MPEAIQAPSDGLNELFEAQARARATPAGKGGRGWAHVRRPATDGVWYDELLEPSTGRGLGEERGSHKQTARAAPAGRSVRPTGWRQGRSRRQGGSAIELRRWPVGGGSP